MSKQRVTRERIDELLRFLPLFEGPAERTNPEWHGLDGQPGADGALVMPYPTYPAEVVEFFKLAGQPCWSDQGYEPAAAGEMLADEQAVAGASLSDIKTMLTFCVRGERFCDGHWAALIREGRVAALLRRLQQLRDSVL